MFFLNGLPAPVKGLDNKPSLPADHHRPSLASYYRFVKRLAEHYFSNRINALLYNGAKKLTILLHENDFLLILLMSIFYQCVAAIL